MGTINIQSTDLSHKAGLTYTGTSDKTIDVNNVLQTSDTTASIASGKVVVNSSGNVGIGTSFLKSNNRLTLSASSGNNGLEIQNSDDTNRGGRLVATGAAASGTVALNTTSSGYALTFGIDSVEKARIDSTGNLLIGTTTDNGVDKLQINGTISSGTARFVSDLNGLKNSLGQFLTGDFTWNGATGAPCTFGTVHQISRGTLECTQFAIDMVTANLYSRRCVSGTWTSWRTI